MSAPGEVADATVIDRAPFDFETVFYANYERIARAIVRVVGDPATAEELAAEAFWRLSRTPAAQGADCGGWLYRTAIRLALDELRRRARHARHARWLSMFSRVPPTPHDVLAGLEEQTRVRAVLAALPHRDAELLLLYSDEAPYREIAVKLALNSASVGTLLRRARMTFENEYKRRYGQER